MTQMPLQSVEGPATAAPTLGPADIWRIIRKHLKLIVACFVVIGLGGTGAIITWAMVAPSYSVEAIVEVKPGQSTGLADLQSSGTVVPIQLFEQYMAAQAMAIERYDVLDAALTSLGSLQTTYTGDEAVMDLSKDIKVSYIPRSQNIAVSLAGYKNLEITQIVSAVLKAYTASLEKDRKEEDSQRQKDLQAEREDLVKQLTYVRQQMDRLREDAGTVVFDENRSDYATHIGVLTQRIVNAKMERSEAENAWNQFQKLYQQAVDTKDNTELLAAFPEVQSSLRDDPSLTAASQVVSRADQNLQILIQRYGPEHDAVAQARASLQSAQNDLENARSEALGRLIQEHAGTLLGNYTRTRDTQAQLESEIARVQSDAKDFGEKVAKYRNFEKDSDRVQKLLNTVANGIEQIRISSAMTRPNVRVTQWPKTPSTGDYSQPRPVLYSVALILFSLAVGVALSFLLEFVDTRLRTPTQVIRQVGVPLLSSIPDISEDERLTADTPIALVSHLQPRSLMAEAFRNFRTSLLFASDRPIKSLLITSPNPGDGKSAAACNLAITLARSGSRVLLVEANYRRPTLARTFDLPESVGLSNVLVGLNPAADVIRSTSIENLDVVPGGPPPPSPADLLGSDGMRRFIEEQSRRYDHVIIDGAPILIVADCHLLAEAVDAVVLVFKAGENSRGMARRAAGQVVHMRARLLGAVLNAVRATKGGYFREAYQAYYDYSASSAVAASSLVAGKVASPPTAPVASSPTTPSDGATPET